MFYPLLALGAEQLLRVVDGAVAYKFKDKAGRESAYISKAYRLLGITGNDFLRVEAETACSSRTTKPGVSSFGSKHIQSIVGPEHP